MYAAISNIIMGKMWSRLQKKKQKKTRQTKTEDFKVMEESLTCSKDQELLLVGNRRKNQPHQYPSCKGWKKYIKCATGAFACDRQQ